MGKRDRKNNRVKIRKHPMCRGLCKVVYKFTLPETKRTINGRTYTQNKADSLSICFNCMWVRRDQTGARTRIYRTDDGEWKMQDPSKGTWVPAPERYEPYLKDYFKRFLDDVMAEEMEL